LAASRFLRHCTTNPAVAFAKSSSALLASDALVAASFAFAAVSARLALAVFLTSANFIFADCCLSSCAAFADAFFATEAVDIAARLGACPRIENLLRKNYFGPAQNTFHLKACIHYRGSRDTM
jgi:hypothetical protein